jgi:uncharacterized protein (TIGR00661 family)
MTLKIAYALSGEGRGHTMRASALGQRLLDSGYDVQFFCSGDSTEPLTERFGKDKIHDLPTPRFNYNEEGQLLLWKTSKNFIKFMLSERKRILRLSSMLKKEEFDVVISDYEPLMSRAANNANIPLVSFDSQGFVDICEIPPKHKALSLQIILVNRLITTHADHKIVSKPFKLAVRKQLGCLVGPMIRDYLIGKKWKGGGGFVLLYYRPSVSSTIHQVREWAKRHGWKLKVYGRLRPEDRATLDHPDVEECKISEKHFIDDIIRSELVVGTAGTQMIGELAYLGAPAVLIPEAGHKEQLLNAQLAAADFPNINYLPHHKVNFDYLEEVYQTITGRGERYIENGTDAAFESFVKWAETLPRRSR